MATAVRSTAGGADSGRRLLRGAKGSAVPTQALAGDPQQEGLRAREVTVRLTLGLQNAFSNVTGLEPRLLLAKGLIEVFWAVGLRGGSKPHCDRRGPTHRNLFSRAPCCFPFCSFCFFQLRRWLFHLQPGQEVLRSEGRFCQGLETRGLLPSP